MASENLRCISWVNDMVMKIVGYTAILKKGETLKLVVSDQRVNTVQDVAAVFVKTKWKVVGSNCS